MPPSRRDELVDAAMKIFYRNGFHNTGLDQIQKESGISKMTLYNHFKSKGELIVAALRRRDEIFRNQLMKFVEASSKDPIDRLMAVFSYHETWFDQDSFRGCMFINASAEFCDCECPARRVSAEHKLSIVRYLEELCLAAGLEDPAELAQQLNLVLEGSIVNAHVVGKVCNNDQTPASAIQRAIRMSKKLIEEAQSN
jgi:AcrR family transcriptional regulator